MERRSTELSPVTIRLALAVDVEALAEVERRAGERFRAIGLAEIADDNPPSPDVFFEAIDEGRLWVVLCDGGVAGYSLAMALDGQAHLEQVSVLPEYGSRDIGASLVAAVAGWASGLGDSLTLSTFRDVAWNGPWYERLGFVVLAEDQLTPQLRNVRTEEVADGVDMAPRVFMRLSLVDGA